MSSISPEPPDNKAREDGKLEFHRAQRTASFVGTSNPLNRDGSTKGQKDNTNPPLAPSLKQQQPSSKAFNEYIDSMATDNDVEANVLHTAATEHENSSSKSEASPSPPSQCVSALTSSTKTEQIRPTIFELNATGSLGTDWRRDEAVPGFHKLLIQYTKHTLGETLHDFQKKRLAEMSSKDLVYQRNKKSLLERVDVWILYLKVKSLDMFAMRDGTLSLQNRGGRVLNLIIVTLYLAFVFSLSLYVLMDSQNILTSDHEYGTAILYAVATFFVQNVSMAVPWYIIEKKLTSPVLRLELDTLLNPVPDERRRDSIFKWTFLSVYAMFVVLMIIFQQPHKSPLLGD
jgi:hypothetical protein